MDVEIVEKFDSARDEYVRRQRYAKICHLFEWAKITADVLKHKNLYLVARENSICGVLPVTYVRSRYFGNRMVSQAMSNYGGIIADSDRAQEMLFNKAVKLAKDLGCVSVEFRNTSPLPYELKIRTGKICMHLPLAADPETIWKSFDTKVRNQVRKAEKSAITVISGAEELLEKFYKVYTIRMKQLGTPCFSRIFMREILRKLPDNSRVFIANLGDVTVGGAFTVCFNGFAEIPWAATLVEYNSLCPNNLLYWSVIKHYSLAGAGMFDFGRCTIDGPTYQFKKQWGTMPVDLYYQYWVHPSHKFEISSPDNPRYKRKVEMWKRLPLWITRLAGPLISRNLP